MSSGALGRGPCRGPLRLHRWVLAQTSAPLACSRSLWLAPPDSLADPQLTARGFFSPVHHPELGYSAAGGGPVAALRRLPAAVGATSAAPGGGA